MHVFGVRHLSPGASWHLLRFLNEVKPKAVLVEGPADFTPVIKELTDRRVKPPVALLAYTRSLPVRSMVYPFANYSPEFQALRWARSHRALARFIDLPSPQMLGLEAHEPTPADRDATAGDPENGEQEDTPLTKHELRSRVYDSFARSAGAADYETYWEQRFEHNLAPNAYRDAALAFGSGLRSIESEHADLDLAENLVREAHMRREIKRCIEDDGIPPDKIVVVVGAFHASAVAHCDDAMTDRELALVPALETDLTLMHDRTTR